MPIRPHMVLVIRAYPLLDSWPFHRSQLRVRPTRIRPRIIRNILISRRPHRLIIIILVLLQRIRYVYYYFITLYRPKYCQYSLSGSFTILMRLWLEEIKTYLMNVMTRNCYCDLLPKKSWSYWRLKFFESIFSLHFSITFYAICLW